jgi:Ca2+-binding EF-hand superfamily protein
MQMNKLTILSGVALFALAGTAMAQGPGERPDRNADVTRAQVIERTDQMFARLDDNRDGRITPEELVQQREQRRAELAGRVFDRLDLDHNGSVTREEMTQARAQRQAQRAERRAEAGPGMQGPGGMRGHRGMRRGPGGPGGPGMGGGRMFGEQGFVTAEQFRARALERFDRTDADHDGTVTAAERRGARMQMRRQWQERRGQRG